MHSMFSHKLTLARSCKEEDTAQVAEYISKKDGEILLSAPFQYQDVKTHKSQLSQLSETMISLEFLRLL